MNYSKKAREIYNHDRAITCERLGISENQYNWFRREGQRLHQIYEWNCNGVELDGTEVTEERYNELTTPLYEKIDKKAKELNLYIFYQTDPRGATIYLSKDPIADNNYNHMGSECIY